MENNEANELVKSIDKLYTLKTKNEKLFLVYDFARILYDISRINEIGMLKEKISDKIMLVQTMIQELVEE